MDLILAIDTATSAASVALWTPYAVLAEETWVSSANHTVELMPTIVRLLERQQIAIRGKKPSELTGLAATLGPGSFSGVRIGLSLVKGLSLALGIPLAAVPTLDVLAYGQSARFMPVRAVLRAGRGRFCWADYRWQRGSWQQRGVTALGRPADMVLGVRERTLFCGELGEPEVTIIREQLGAYAVVASPAENLRRASHLAELAYRRLQRQQADDLTVVPTYLTPLSGGNAAG